MRLSSVLVAILSIAASWRAQGPVRTQGAGKPFQDVNIELMLGPGDPTDPARRTFFKTHKVHLVAGATYCIDLKDADAKPLPKVLPGVKIVPEQLCDPYLKLKDPMGREVAFDDDSGGRLDARILYKAKQTGVHEIVATTCNPGQTGRFTLTVRTATPAHWLELWNVRSAKAPGTARPELQQQLDEFRAALEEKGKTIKLVELRPLQRFAYALEPNAKDLAREVYGLLAAVADQAADAGVAQFAGAFRNAQKRLGSVGQEIALRGTTADGQTFDLKELRGKHVLLCFSIRSDQANVISVSSMNLLHSAYKDRGFEIVEITAHPDRRALTAQLQKLQPPWKVLVDERPPTKGIGPLFEEFGVAFVPACILVDKDQRVVGLTSLQPERDQLLAKSLGPLFVPKGNVPPPRDKGVLNPPLAKGPPGMPHVRASPVDLLLMNLITLLVLLVIFSLFALILAFQAMKRGYNFGVWFLAGLLSLNPILLLVLLGLLPNRRMQRLRRMETELIDDLIDEDMPVTAVMAEEQGDRRQGSKTAPARAAEETTAPLPKQSIGDVETQA